MRTTKPVRTAGHEGVRGKKPAFATTGADEAQDMFGSGEPDEAQEPETYEIFRVTCPDCRQPIGLFAEEETIPEHALCASPWDPFGLTVCQGSGRAATEAVPYDGDLELQEHGVAALLTLPEGLDWRMQPFSHAGEPAGQVSSQMRRG